MIFEINDYKSKLSIYDTELAIKKVKDTFEKKLANKLKLIRVSAPLFVNPNTGLNDNLSGIEKPVSFEIFETGEVVEIVHSLAKWKRMALKKYNISDDTGIYTDMNAIRRCEETDNLHSIYVDQWDWEKVITKKSRNENYLKETVSLIYEAFLETVDEVKSSFNILSSSFAKNVTFITSEELFQMYPSLSSSEREKKAAEKYKTIFIMKIGDELSNGTSHDKRSPDYDDWQLNGDIIIYDEILKRPVEISSMGIRVDKKSLKKQLKKANCLDRLNLPYHQEIMNDELPLSIGGGIGQSRLCLLILEKAHIGEVQVSEWQKEDILKLKEKNIFLL